MRPIDPWSAPSTTEFGRAPQLSLSSALLRLCFLNSFHFPLDRRRMAVVVMPIRMPGAERSPGYIFYVVTSSICRRGGRIRARDLSPLAASLAAPRPHDVSHAFRGEG